MLQSLRACWTHLSKVASLLVSLYWEVDANVFLFLMLYLVQLVMSMFILAYDGYQKVKRQATMHFSLQVSSWFLPITDIKSNVKSFTHVNTNSHINNYVTAGSSHLQQRDKQLLACGMLPSNFHQQIFFLLQLSNKSKENLDTEQFLSPQTKKQASTETSNKLVSHPAYFSKDRKIISTKCKFAIFQKNY